MAIKMMISWLEKGSKWKGRIGVWRGSRAAKRLRRIICQRELSKICGMWRRLRSVKVGNTNLGRRAMSTLASGTKLRREWNGILWKEIRRESGTLWMSWCQVEERGNTKTNELSKKPRMKEVKAKRSKSGLHVENKKSASKVGEKRCHAVGHPDISPVSSNVQPMAEGEEKFERKRFRATDEDTCFTNISPAETAMQSCHSQ
jgi:hypothetical protein